MGSDDDQKKPLSPEQQAIFEENLPLATKLAHEMAPKLRMDQDDLESVGREALWELAWEWEPGLPWSFVATAYKRITWAMHREHRKQNPELERERVARRRREEKGEEEPEITAQPTTSPLQEMLSRTRVKTFDPLKDDVFPHELRDMTTSLSTKVGRKLTAELIMEAAEEFPEAERKLIASCVLEEISPNELASRLGQHHSTVNRKLERVTKKLRKICKQRNITW